MNRKRAYNLIIVLLIAIIASFLLYINRDHLFTSGEPGVESSDSESGQTTHLTDGSDPGEGDETDRVTDSSQTPGATDDDIDDGVLTFEDIVENSTHIVVAEYKDTILTYGQGEQQFVPVRTLKGELTEADEFVIFVLPNQSDPAGDQSFQQGEHYLLFLQKNRSVYYTQDKFSRLNNYVFDASDENWEQEIENTERVIEQVPDSAPPHYGVPFTLSEDLDDILDVSENIFVVEIVSVFAESTVDPTTVYQGLVRQVVRNQPGHPTRQGDILITLFDHTVDIGQEYLLLLAEADESTPLYTLSSRNSVYTLEEAEDHEILVGLLDEAVDFDARIQD